VDLLRELLTLGHARGAVFAQTDIGPDDGLQFSGPRLLAVHAVLDGEAWFEREGCAPVALDAGNLMLVPRGAPYRIVPFPGARTVDHQVSDSGVMVTMPRPDASGRLLGGAYTMQAPLGLLLLHALSPLMPVHCQRGDRRLALTFRLMADELADPRPSGQELLNHTLDVLLALSLRAWFAEPSAGMPAWYRALKDPVVGPAIYAIHADPAHAWTVEELADLAPVSRARFARRFREVIGTPPVASLTQWRMTVAAQMLVDEPAAGIAAVAAHVGYRSESAFAAAFRRHFGVSPGRWRRHPAPVGSAAG
jgi:AraC-like DNA-binding protein